MNKIFSINSETERFFLISLLVSLSGNVLFRIGGGILPALLATIGDVMLLVGAIKFVWVQRKPRKLWTGAGIVATLLGVGLWVVVLTGIGLILLALPQSK